MIYEELWSTMYCCLIYADMNVYRNSDDQCQLRPYNESVAVNKVAMHFQENTRVAAETSRAICSFFYTITLNYSKPGQLRSGYYSSKVWKEHKVRYVSRKFG